MDTATRELDIARRIEKAAARDWLQTSLLAPPHVVAATGMQIERFGEAFAVTMPLQEHYPVNGPGGVGSLEPATDTLIENLIAYFRERKIDFGIGVTPVSDPPNLADVLLKRGFTISGRIPVLYRAATPVAQIQIPYRVERIEESLADVWKATFQKVFVGYLSHWQKALIGKPNRYHYLVWDGDIPVAASQMSVADGVGFAHFSVVDSAYRGRGIHLALIERRIQDAADAGCDWISSTADEEEGKPGRSMQNMLNRGFEVLHYSQGYDFKR